MNYEFGIMNEEEDFRKADCGELKVRRYYYDGRT
jgi:hypothetical protein